MSITSEIIRIQTNIADAYDAAEAKGATLPAVENTENLASTIESITTGGGSSSGEEITAYNYTFKVLTQGDWVHYNTTVISSSLYSENINNIGTSAGGMSVLLYDNNHFLYKDIIKTSATIVTLNSNSSVSISMPANSWFSRIDKNDCLISNYGCAIIDTKNVISYNSSNSSNEIPLSNNYIYNNSTHQIYKINLSSGEKIETYELSESSSSITGTMRTGWVSEKDELFMIDSSNKNIYKINIDSNSTYSLTSVSENNMCNYSIGRIDKFYIAQYNNYLKVLTYNESLNKFEIVDSDLLPSKMITCLAADSQMFVNEKYNIFMSMTNNTPICCQYLNGKWLDKSPNIDMSFVSFYVQLGNRTAFTCSFDFTKSLIATHDNTDRYGGWKIFNGNELANGNYLISYSYTNSDSKMGKVKENVDAAIGTQCTVVIPKV